MAAALCCALLICCSGAIGQTVSLSGSLGEKALLLIDGMPRTVAVGSTVNGVQLISLANGNAVVEVKGKRITLGLGGAQVNLGGAPSGGNGGKIVLSADGAGHFFTAGTINGRSVRFLVDTGATNIGIGQADADRLGLDYRNGEVGYSNTANGPVPVYHVSLTSVRIGDVQVYNVDASVLPAQMGYVLLGNSFLTRFQMKRENDTLTLDKRF